MKAWKRLGTALVTLFALAALTGTALAAEAAPRTIAVQMNGQPLAFSDAAPEAVDGRTFVPLYAVTDALGAQVDYDGGTRTVTIQRDGAVLSMVLGEDKAVVTGEGQTRTIEMDVAPYAKNNRTYVPLAFVADALGCGVGWDQAAYTVVIVDADALLGDATFDLMDRFAAYCDQQGQTWNMTTLTGALDLSIEDKSGTALVKPVSAKGSIDGVAGEKGLQLNWTLDLSGLAGLAGAAGTSPMEQAVVQGLQAALSELEGEVRMDLESGMLYLTLPGVLTGSEQDAWYSVDLNAYQAELLGGLDMARLTRLKDAGIREVLAEVIRSMPLTDSVNSYAQAAEVTEMYTRLLSDRAFTQEGNAYVARTALEDILDMTVTLTRRGDDIVSADVVMTCDVTEDGESVTMTMTEHAAPDKVTVDMDMAMEAEGMAVRMKLDCESVPTDKAPVTALPAGVQAVPLA